MSSKFNEIRTKLRNTSDYVCDCKIRISKGEMLDLSGLDTVVSGICFDINSLPQEEGVEFKDDMKKLIDLLDGLAEEIQARYIEG